MKTTAEKIADRLTQQQLRREMQEAELVEELAKALGKRKKTLLELAEDKLGRKMTSAERVMLQATGDWEGFMGIEGEQE